MQEEVDRLVNDMQNCSLSCNEEASVSAEISNALHLNMNGVQNAKQPKQGSKSSSGKDFMYQIHQKGKQTGTVRGNNNMI